MNIQILMVNNNINCYNKNYNNNVMMILMIFIKVMSMQSW